MKIRLESRDSAALTIVEAALAAAEHVQVPDPGAVYDRSRPRRDGRPGTPGLVQVYVTAIVDV
ncbi:hypothetical protein AB0I28_32635 [Phytomonospora sp. NPDC050363]|uniref:hypothetical protein n=1 Tax=Phytomonospora sp. NPDC050363 TaxID=3155642 RepID=UPI00340543F7